MYSCCIGACTLDGSTSAFQFYSVCSLSCLSLFSHLEIPVKSTLFFPHCHHKLLSSLRCYVLTYSFCGVEGFVAISGGKRLVILKMCLECLCVHVQTSTSHIVLCGSTPVERKLQGSEKLLILLLTL